MTFERALELLKSFEGDVVSVSLTLSHQGRRRPTLAALSGKIDRVVKTHSGSGGEAWAAWLEDQDGAPGPTMFVLDRRTFVGGRTAGPDPFRIWLYHHGVTTEVEVWY